MNFGISRLDDSDIIHLWKRCHACNVRPILGKCFECTTCPSGPNNALCDKCYSAFRNGEPLHPFGSAHNEDSVSTNHEFIEVYGLPRSRYSDWLEVPIPDTKVPTISERFVVRPEFDCGDDVFFGAYSFAVYLEQYSGSLLLTALHVLDELMKSRTIDASATNQQYTGRELGQIIKRVGIYDIFAPQWMFAYLGQAGPILSLPNARINDPEPQSYRDIAAFRIDPDANVLPAQLATYPPVTGDPVWLIANLGKSVPRKAIGAVVVERTETALVYRVQTGILPPEFTSGAPIVNSVGSVVGINIGSGFLDGNHFGHANHVTNIRRHLNIL